MKKLKIIVASVLAVAALGACAAAVGCKKTESHTHTYAWDCDETHHWRKPTCGHDVENIDYGEHQFEDGVCPDCGYEREALGLEVTKTTTEYKMTSLKRTISTADISVSYVDADGDKKEVPKTDYTLSYYKGNTQISSMANLTESGAYNIWATVQTEGGKTLEGFVVVYLIEDVTNFTRNENFVGDSSVTQDLGRDVISDKWNFDVTYSSGRTETVNVIDSRIVRTGFSTYIAGSGKLANVKFTYTNCIGEEQSFGDDVYYSVNRKENSDIVYNAYSFEDFTTNLTEKGMDVSQSTIKLAQENFTGKNAFLTLLDGVVNYRGTESDKKNGGLKLIDMRGESLSVTFEGEGIIEINGRSNGESAYSAIAVKNAAGEYMSAIYTPSKFISKDDNDNIYAITGSSMNSLIFEIPEAGTYTIVTIDEVLVEDNTIDTSNPVRLGALATTDILVKEGN